jgi:pyruvate dehydrogenase E2 component (dihydrolipoamide acetyltransferase)
MPDVLLPKWGVSMKEATVVRWYKKAGESVAVGEVLADLETDKVETSLQSPYAGTLTRILVDEDQTVGVGSALAVIE